MISNTISSFKILMFVLIASYQYAWTQIDANSVMGLPTAATNAEMNAITTAATGSILYNLQENKIYVFDGTNWVSTSNDNWLVTGNNGLPSTSFLGHTDDVRMEIRSNNLPLLQFGRRQTLGLVQTITDYTDPDQPLVRLNGNGTTSALQFTAAAASFYKPLFFTTTNGSFRLKGSAGVTDLFEIGSTGPANDGRLEFIIGDDGDESMVFKRFDYRRGQFHREFFRVQGSNNSPDATTRFGINLNPQEVPIDSDYDDPSTGFNIANSTLQLEGSFSTSITNTTGNLTLTEDHYTIVITGAHTITLPNANTCQGRTYVLKNTTNASRSISNYVDLSNANQNTIPANSVIRIQSNGSSWQLINNLSSGGTTPSTLTYVDKYNTSDTNLSINGFNTNGFQIPLNTARVSSGPINNLTNDQVQVTENGIYEISYTVTVLKNQNVNRPTFEVVISENTNPIANTGTMLTLPGAANANRYANASRTVILNLNAFQSYGIKIRGVNSTSTVNVTIIGQGTGMTLKKL